MPLNSTLFVTYFRSMSLVFIIMKSGRHFQQDNPACEIAHKTNIEFLHYLGQQQRWLCPALWLVVMHNAQHTLPGMTSRMYIIICVNKCFPLSKWQCHIDEDLLSYKHPQKGQWGFLWPKVDLALKSHLTMMVMHVWMILPPGDGGAPVHRNNAQPLSSCSHIIHPTPALLFLTNTIFASIHVNKPLSYACGQDRDPVCISGGFLHHHICLFLWRPLDFHTDFD